MTRIATTLIAALALVWASGCSRQHRRPLNPQAFVGQTVTVNTTRGQSLRVRATPNGEGADWYTKSGRHVPSEEVVSVKTVSHGRGFVDGLGVGALSGAGIGIVLGIAAGSDEPCESQSLCFSFSAGQKATALGFVGGVGGAAIGGVLGLIAGSRDYYVNPTGEGAIPQVTVVPTDGGAMTGMTWKF